MKILNTVHPFLQYEPQTKQFLSYSILIKRFCMFIVSQQHSILIHNMDLDERKPVWSVNRFDTFWKVSYLNLLQAKFHFSI